MHLCVCVCVCLGVDACACKSYVFLCKSYIFLRLSVQYCDVTVDFPQIVAPFRFWIKFSLSYRYIALNCIYCGKMPQNEYNDCDNQSVFGIKTKTKDALFKWGLIVFSAEFLVMLNVGCFCNFM